MGSKKKTKKRPPVRQRPGHATSTPVSGDARTVVFGIIHKALNAFRDRDAPAFERQLDLLTMSPGDVVDASIGEITFHILASNWKHGWQPFDVVREIERQLGKPHRRWAIDMIAAEMGDYPRAKIHDRWQGQLADLGAEVWWNSNAEHMRLWTAREALDRSLALRCAVEVMAVINYNRSLPLLMPPPGEARSGSLLASARAQTADRRMLDKVRALLAKAESTGFAEEADAYSAKAQELMARYSIDHALLAGQDDDPDQPVGVRITIDNPYADAKSYLLQMVAEANMCRSVWADYLGCSTVFGFPSDIEIVDILFTSLLVQGSAAMVREGSGTQPGGSRRTRSFRQSFLHAYAVRIGERLRAVSTDASAAAARDDERLLPVLASREQAVNERMRAAFPTSTTSSIRISSEHGWTSGTAAADRASLHQQPPVKGR